MLLQQARYLHMAHLLRTYERDVTRHVRQQGSRAVMDEASGDRLVLGGAAGRAGVQGGDLVAAGDAVGVGT